MTGEAQIARAALVWSAVLALPSIGVAYLAYGAKASTSVALAFGIILGNLAVSGLFAAVAARIGGMAPIAMSLPSLAIRLLMSAGILAAVKGQPFIDEPVFVASFCLALTVVLALQSRAWKRTPWLFLAFSPTKKEIV